MVSSRERSGRAILDGEALWMGEAGPASFQDTMSQMEADAPAGGLVTFLFDVLHIDGRDLLDTPLRERSLELRKFASHLIVPSLLTNDVATAERVLAESLEAGHEGVVVKEATSTYAAGRRGLAQRRR